MLDENPERGEGLLTVHEVTYVSHFTMKISFIRYMLSLDTVYFNT